MKYWTKRLFMLIVTVVLTTSQCQVNANEYFDSFSGQSKGGISFIEDDLEYTNETTIIEESHEGNSEREAENNEDLEINSNKKLPQTGENKTILISLLGFIISAFTLFLLRKMSNNRT